DAPGKITARRIATPRKIRAAIRSSMSRVRWMVIVRLDGPPGWLSLGSKGPSRVMRRRGTAQILMPSYHSPGRFAILRSNRLLNNLEAAWPWWYTGSRFREILEVIHPKSLTYTYS